MSSQDAAKRGSWPGQDMKFGIEQWGVQESYTYRRKRMISYALYAPMYHLSMSSGPKWSVSIFPASTEQRMKKNIIAANH